MGITTMKWKGMGIIIIMVIRRDMLIYTRGWIPTFGRHHEL